MKFILKMELEMNEHELALQQGRALATGTDPFASYGAKHRIGNANYLAFKNGEWLYGQNDTELPLGTHLAANMSGLRVGWRKWWAAQVADDRTVLLVEQMPEEPRQSLGDTDPAMWELSPEGKPRDPWVRTNILELADHATGQTYLYATQSKGGIGCIGALCEAYSKLHRQRPAEWVPIVEIGNDFYTHPQYGKTYVPTLVIVGWLDEAGKPAGDEPAERAAAPATPAQSKKVPRF